MRKEYCQKEYNKVQNNIVENKLGNKMKVCNVKEHFYERNALLSQFSLVESFKLAL